MVESVLVSLSLVLAILLVANPIQAKPAENQRISSNASTVITSNVQTLPRTFILDSSLLANANQGVRNNNNNTILQASLKQLIIQADLFLTKKATSVVEKTLMPANGNKHDYLSLSPYYWPDPTKPNGLPYIIHDGIVNPQAHSIPDKQNLEDMIHRVRILSLAYYFTDNPQYASKAVELLRVWFLDNGTRMNPDLLYAEMTPGKNNGSSTGIMDAHNIPDIIDAIGLIQHSPLWTKQDQLDMQLWFSKYLNWLLNSDFGKKEAQAVNNHGTWYYVQASSIALFLNKTDIAKNILESTMHNLIPQEIRPDGRQPFELRRTNSWDYSTFNLQGLFELASIGLHVGVDLWNYKIHGAAKPLLHTALDYLLPYALKTRAWAYPQIALPMNTKSLSNLLCQATTHSYSKNNQVYIQSYKSLNIEKDIAINIDNLIYTCSSHLT
ncbi:MAG TPA: alginate lyase family protein [Nitrososphaeraceae archaeon]|nr:alginate lyase family protein [Nitrososphaeraceae archaeon]